MKHLPSLFVVCCCAVVCAQDTLAISGPAKAPAGSTQTLAIQYTSPVADAAAIQWAISGLPSSFTATPSAGPAVTSAAKTLTCNPANGMCLVVGGINLLTSGQIASVALAIPLKTAGQRVTLSLTNPLGATPAGSAVSLATGPAYTLAIQKKTALASALAWLAKDHSK